MHFMRSPFFYIVLLVLVVLDGWLLSHPNLIGRAGVLFFDYTYLETFPKALGTVAVVAGLALLIAGLARRLGQIIGIGIVVALLALSGYWLIDSFTLYNGGVYKLTGAGFRAGAILLPGICVLVFGEKLLTLIQGKLARR
jgi:hypothetical protein